MECFGIDDEIGERVAITHGTDIAHFGPLDAESLGVTVDAFGRGALRVDGLVEWSGAIERHTHQATWLDIDVFDAAFALGKLRVVAGLAAGVGEEQRTAVALGTVAMGMSKLVGRLHRQALGTQGDAIDIAREDGMAMLIERNSSDATMADSRLIHIPGIEGGIGSDMSRKEAQDCKRLEVEGAIVGDIVLVERLGVLGQHDVAIISRDGRDDARAVAPQVLLAYLGRPIRLLLVGRAFDAHPTVRVTCGLAVLAEAIKHGLTRVVFFVG